MSSEITTIPEVAAEVTLSLPPHLIGNFERADAQLRERYGDAPGVAALVRLWLACSTSSQIRKEFELAVLSINRRDTDPSAEIIFDEELF